MPWPDFTELTFGFAFLCELEQKYTPGGRFPNAPEFISQRAEATRGYDVEVTLDGTTPTFFQIKRSYVLVRRSAREIQQGPFTDPKIYRMCLHKNDNFRQHRALQELEDRGNAVFYATSQIPTQEDLAKHYNSRTILSKASAIFSPKEIDLPPDTTQDHCVSFQPGNHRSFLYSEKQASFERRFLTDKSWLQFVADRDRSVSKNRQLLKETVEFLTKEKEQIHDSNTVEQMIDTPVLRMIRDQPLEAQAAILSYFILDAQLSFVKPEDT